MPAPSSSLAAERMHWWLGNKKVVEKYLREARALIRTQEQSNVSSAIVLLDAALAVSPSLEATLELKARSLLFLRRFREVADMLQDYIPSYKIGAANATSSAGDDESFTSLGSGDHSSAPLNREAAKLLSPGRERSDESDRSFRCFSVANLKRKVLAAMSKNSDRESQWRYLVLGQACSHLGLMEDAMVLLQTGRRLASAAFRRESVCWSEDSFASCSISDTGSGSPSGAPPPPSESESASQLLSHIKLLLRRRTAAVAALDAGLPSEAVRHFSKVLDGRRSIPSGFAAGCFIGRAAASRAAGRLADAIADCNRALALEPSSIPALRARADLLEAFGALPDCLRDLDHLKLLYDAILRDRKLLGPSWRQHNDVRYRDIPANLRELTARTKRLRTRISAGEACNVDYYALIGVRRGCSRSELESAHLVLTLKHKPDKAAAFIDRLEFADEYRDLDSITDQAKMSAMILYRMLAKGYSIIMCTVMDEEAAERRRAAAAAAAVAAPAAVSVIQVTSPQVENKVFLSSDKFKEERNSGHKQCSMESETAVAAAAAAAAAAAVFQGVFCRDMAVVGSMLAHSHRAIPVNYEALSC